MSAARGPTYTERVRFRMLRCPSCGHQFCWVNPRLPTYCPECGDMIFARLGDAVLYTDEDAVLITAVQLPPQ